MRVEKRRTSDEGVGPMISIVAFTAKGCILAEKIADILKDRDCKAYSKTRSDSSDTIMIGTSLSKWTEDAMKNSEAVIFVGATGIAVRMIAPYIKDKKEDPAVVCLDDNGRFVISLLSGHVGGANRLTSEIASGIGAVPVITTATDVNGKFAIDEFASMNGMRFRGKKTAKDIASYLLDGKTVGFRSEYPVEGKLPEGFSETEECEIGAMVSSKCTPDMPFKSTLVLVPEIHIVGMGCKKDIPYENVRSLFCETLKKMNISICSVRAIASIDLKKEEPALKELCKEFGIPSVFFTSEELNSLDNIGYSESNLVRSVTGVDCVCERSAIKASKNGKLILRKTSKNGVTIAIAEENFKITFKGETK